MRPTTRYCEYFENNTNNLFQKHKKIISKIFGGIKIFVFLQPVSGLADLAQLAERKLPKLQVAGSSPVIRSRNWKLSSVGSERLPYKQEVAGSNPAVSTKCRDVTVWRLFFVCYTRRIKKYTENKIFLL